ncbi:MAG: [protein-PII] uridylyltransferase, partial [Nocardioides kribbensis]
LVRWHLLLSETATTRDPDDPATVDRVASRIRTTEALALLTALTEADAKAASAPAWSSWRAGLVLDLSRRVRTAIDTGQSLPVVETDEVDIPEAVRRGAVSVSVEATPDGSRVTVIAPDRVGLLADFAAMFALQRIAVRAARVWAQDVYGVSVWEVAQSDLTGAFLLEKYDAIVEGRVDPAARLSPPDATTLAPTVEVRADASASATVLEVRTADRPGVVYLVCSALARLDVAVRSAHVDTLGPQAVDVFYLQEAGAGQLAETRAAAAAHAVRATLSGESR